MKTNFSISMILSTAWKALTAHFWVLVGMVIAFLILSFILSMLQSGGGFISIIVMLLSLALSTIFGLGYARMCLDAVEGKEPQFSSFQEQFPKFWRYLGLSMLIGLVAGIYVLLTVLITVIVLGVGSGGDILVGLMNMGRFGILLIVVLNIPLILLGLRVQFASLFIVDADSGIIESLRKSWEITQGHEIKLILLLLLICALLFAGVIAILIGVFPAAVLANLMIAVTYKELSGARNEE